MLLGGSCEHCFTKIHSANSRRPFEVSRWARAGELLFDCCQLLGLSDQFPTPASATSKTSITGQKYHPDSLPVTSLPPVSFRKLPHRLCGLQFSRHYGRRADIQGLKGDARPLLRNRISSLVSLLVRAPSAPDLRQRLQVALTQLGSQLCRCQL